MKKIIITENKEKEIIDYLLTESFAPSEYMVKKAVEFLNDNIRLSRTTVDVDSNGEVKERPVYVLYSQNTKNDLKELSNERELVNLLDDKLKDVIKIKDTNDRKKFLEQVITDWTHGVKSLRHGILSVNYIK